MVFPFSHAQAVLTRGRDGRTNRRVKPVAAQSIHHRNI